MTILDNCKRKLPVKIKKEVYRLLTYVEQDHLVGLDEVVITDQLLRDSRGKVTQARALYKQRRPGLPSKIELSVDQIYKGMPYIFFFVPIVWKFMLAHVLYHEVGHHYHTKLAHGLKKDSIEKFAERYSMRVMAKRFYWWGFVLLPFRPLMRFVRRKATK